MTSNLIRYAGVGIIASSVAWSHAAQADHVIISEVGIAAADAEYIEIYNPTNVTLNLSEYYVTDSNKYSTLPANPGGIDTATTDHIMQFPAGAQLLPGQVAVVCGRAQGLLGEFYQGNLAAFQNIQGSPLLFEVEETNASVDNMTSLNTRAGSELNFGYTNPSATNGEFAIVFHWDGATDLVQDGDIVAWGAPASGQNLYAPKTAADTGANGTPYNVEAGTGAGLSVSTTAKIIRRTLIDEASEGQVGGNGITGHDESTEDVPANWKFSIYPSEGSSPGVVDLALTGGDQPPVVLGLERDIKYPGSGDSVEITIDATDPDGTVTGVTVYVDSTASGVFTQHLAAATGNPNEFSATLSPFADNTVIKYYAVATDGTGSTTSLPTLAPVDFKVYSVADTPIATGDIVINEIVANDPGGAVQAELFELYNNLNHDVNLSFYRVADNNNAYGAIPEGTTITAGGYVVVGVDVADVIAQYPAPPITVPVVDWGNFGLNNGGDDITLVHPNEYLFQGNLVFLDEVIFTDSSPWPTPATGQSIELKNPTFDNSDAGNWALSTATGLATPGAQNSVFEPGAGVSDWSVY